jgi:hypothetical protein
LRELPDDPLISNRTRRGLSEHQTSRQEIQSLFRLADRDLADCRNPTLSADWQFNIAYNAASNAPRRRCDIHLDAPLAQRVSCRIRTGLELLGAIQREPGSVLWPTCIGLVVADQEKLPDLFSGRIFALDQRSFRKSLIES